jgi:hypothetical protein
MQAEYLHIYVFSCNQILPVVSDTTTLRCSLVFGLLSQVIHGL